MIMINELMKMIKIAFIMKVMIIKSKYTSNKSKDTTTNICGNKTIIKHTISILITIMIIIVIIFINNSSL